MQPTSTTSTNHSIDRAKERVGFNEKKAEAMMSLAFKRGKSFEDFTSWERKYLQREAYDDCIALAFNGHCYIFNQEGLCVTMYKLPQWFGKKKHYNGKERIKNYKKYCRNNADFHTNNEQYWEV